MANADGKYEGGCLCEKARYEAFGEVIGVLNCHCPDCRKITGSPFTTAMGIEVQNFRLTNGELGSYIHRAESGGSVTRQFCLDCGSQLFSFTDANPDQIWIKIGTLDDPAGLEPTANCWTRSALDWIPIDPTILNFETQ